MAGIPGFEPGNAGIKNRCLTAWRYPIRPLAAARYIEIGWGTWIRTRECRYQKPVPYRLAIPHPCCRIMKWCGRRDLNSHTLRRQNLNLVRLPISPLPQKKDGGYDGNRTCDPSIMSAVL
ncbi:Uncharacterized protein {ECO:0000313/EMBL:ABJ00072.1} [Pantoea ananatis]|nr:Uncharacterized protein {ECO:0000313/EMBL:ABJ00072.1} [Pantoea ananatis]CRH37466.1 Uncharacterized protein {ECO:0000313/EMBL:ABJ00072.1} [Pantoea ananatis]